MKDISNFIDDLQNLIDAKKLLDRILGHYDVYGAKFDIPDYEKNDFSNWQNYRNTLETEIREYLKFDDSE
jgi:hypothetical protein